MKWEDTNGITGAQLANDHVKAAHVFADRVSVFIHKGATFWQNHDIYETNPISPISLSTVGGGTSYDSAMNRAQQLMNTYAGDMTCVYFVGDGTGSYTPARLNSFINFLNNWSSRKNCPYCVKCIITRTTVTNSYGVSKYWEMCRKMKAEILSEATNRPNKGYGQFPKTQLNLASGVFNLDNPNAGSFATITQLRQP